MMNEQTTEQRITTDAARCAALGITPGYDDIARFATSPDVLAKLLEDGHADPTDCQNDAPTYAEMVEFAKTIQGATLHGYIRTRSWGAG